MVSHANWSRIDGERGHAEQDVTLYDVSPGNDWSQVRVWYRDMDGLGGSTSPVSGFFYPVLAGSAPATVHKARAAAELTGRATHSVPAMIDASAHTSTANRWAGRRRLRLHATQPHTAALRRTPP